MHTRCCEELLASKGGILNNSASKGNSSLLIDCTMIETVPAFVEFRFDIPLAGPGVGGIQLATGLWDGNKARVGNLREVLTFTDIANAKTAGVNPGTIIEFPGGIGRSLVFFNTTDQDYTGWFVSIRKMVTLMSPSADVPPVK